MLQFQIQKSNIQYRRLCSLYALCLDYPAFAPYPTLDELLTALGRRGGADAATQSRILCTVVTRHQASRSPLWTAIVLHAFHDMLGRLSRRLVGVDADEAGGLVAWALVEAMERVRPARDPLRIAMYLRQEMRRVLFAQLQRDGRARGHWPDDEEDDDEARDDALSYDVIDPDTLADPASLVPIEDRLVVWEPTADRVSEEDLLRAHATRGGLRRLTKCLLENASERHRENMYRKLLRRARELVERRK